MITRNKNLRFYHFKGTVLQASVFSFKNLGFLNQNYTNSSEIISLTKDILCLKSPYV